MNSKLQNLFKNLLFKFFIVFTIVLVSNLEGSSQTYNITTTAVNGTISSNTSVSSGTNYRITFVANVGYYLDSIFINNIFDSAITADSTLGYSFNNILANKSIKVVFSRYLSVSTSTNNNGTISSSVNNIKKGNNVRITYLPLNGYRLDSVIINNRNRGKDSLSSYTFFNVYADSSIKAYFSQIPADTLIVSIITDSTATQNYIIPYGGTYRYTYQTPSGYKLDSIVINNVNKGKDSTSSYTLTNVTSNINFKLFYSVAPPDTLTVLVITENTTTQNYIIPYGGTYRYTYQTPTGYKLDSIVVNNVNLGNDSSVGYTFYNVKTNLNFKLFYSVLSATDILTVQVITENTTSQNYYIPSGSTYRYTYQTPSGYKLDSIVINKINKGNDSSTGYTFYNVTSNINFNLYYSVLTASDILTVQIITETVTSQNYTIPYGSDYRYTYQTPSGYKLDSVVIDDYNVGKDSTTGYTFYDVTSNINLKLYYSINDTLYIQIISENTTNIEYKVPYNSNYRITYQTPTGYQLDSIKLNGILVSKDSTTGYTIYSITSNQIFQLYYSLIITPINVAISYTNPACNGYPGVFNILNKNTTQPLNIVVSRPNNTDTTIKFNSQSYVYAGLAGKYQLCFIDQSNLNTKRCYTVNITEPAAIQSYSIGIQDKSLVVYNIVDPVLVKINNGPWTTYSRDNLTLLQSGVNTVVIKNSEACADSIVKSVVIYDDLQIYPNPAKDYVNIFVDADVDFVNISLVNEFGNTEVLEQVQVGQDKTIRLNLAHKPTGSYIIKLDAKNYHATNKLIILK